MWPARHQRRTHGIRCPQASLSFRRYQVMSNPTISRSLPPKRSDHHLPKSCDRPHQTANACRWPRQARRVLAARACLTLRSSWRCIAEPVTRRRTANVPNSRRDGLLATKQSSFPKTQLVVALAAARSLAKMDPVRDAAAHAAEIPLGKTSGGTMANRVSRAAPTSTLEASERESVGSRQISP